MTDVRPAPPITDLPSPAPDSPVEALGWLGGTADEVAANLRLLGIKGRPGQATACPLAFYLRQWWKNASVYTQCIVWNKHEWIAHDGLTPAHCLEFAQKFDKHEYPDLIA